VLVGSWDVTEFFLQSSFGIATVMNTFRRLHLLASDGEQRSCETAPWWQYEQRDAWVDMGRAESATLERALLLGDPQEGKVVELQVGEACYEVDLHTMMQLNVSLRRERQLRRTSTKHGEWQDPLSAEQFQNLITSRSHRDTYEYPDSKCVKFQNIEVVNVQVVKSSSLRKKYDGASQDLRNKYRRFHVDLEAVDSLADLQVHTTDASINERFYFHGTNAGTASKIAQFGFDERFSDGMYGFGLYFTPDACKALQYSHEDESGICTLLLSRVLVGNPYYTQRTCRDIRHPPEKCEDTGLLFDSVIARPGPMPGAPRNVQHHTEVVIFDGAQTCPVYIVRIRLQ